MNELKSVTRTRRTVNAMLWLIVAGAVFYSLMTSTPLVSAHSEWSWSGWALGALTDAAFVLAISADATLSKYGMTGGRWPTAFRWVTGLASLFLNTWNSVNERDWVGVAIHSISPVILVCAAEVAPIYRRKFRDLELELTEVHSGSKVQVQSELGSNEVHTGSNPAEVQSELAGGSNSGVQSELGSKPAEVHTGSKVQVHTGSKPVGSSSVPGVQSELTGSSGAHSDAGSGSKVQVQSELAGSQVQSELAGSQVQSELGKVHSGLGSKAPGSKVHTGSNQQAIREGFMNQKTASEVARDIGVSPSYVAKKYREFKHAS